MKEQIEAALRPLLGEPLTDMWRYAGCQKFEFGVQRSARNRSGEEITLADFGLVVSCDWRITGPAGEVAASDNFGPGDRRRDGEAKPFYHLIHTFPPIVEGIEAGEDGAFRIRLTQGLMLDVVPVLDIEPHDEQWRLMSKLKDQEHLVLWGDGLRRG